MDDQNQTNQPLDQGAAPNVPLDITPQTSPAPTISPVMEPIAPPTTTFTTTVTTPTPEVPSIPTPTPAPFEPVAIPQPEPMTTFTTTVSTPTPMPSEPVSTPVVEPEMPKGKPKNKILPIIGGIMALLLVIGVAGAAYYVSNQLSTRQAVAPNAPTSKPMAAISCSTGNGNPCEDPEGKLRGLCYNNICNIAEIWCNNGSGCSGWYAATQSCTQWCPPGTGGGGGEGGGGATACTRDTGSGGAGSCYLNTSQENVCNTAPYTFGCGMECCNTSFGGNAGIACCCGGCFPAGTDCSQHGCAVTATCDATKRDTPAAKTLTFAKAGRVIPFVKNDTDGGYTGTITLSKTGSADINITLVKGAAVELTPFSVSAGDVYTIKARFDGDPKDAYGWIPNKSNDICGPVKTPGPGIDANSTPTGMCGDEINISAVKTLAAKADLTDITAGGTNATVQCWGDAELGDATQDYDYNDFTLIFGYEKMAAGVTWNITAVPVCPAGTTPKASIRMFRIIWPQLGQSVNDFDCVNDQPSSAVSHNMSISSKNITTNQGIYVGLESVTGTTTDTNCTAEGTIGFQPTLITPSVTTTNGNNPPATGDYVDFAKYFNPSTWMAHWYYNRLTAGSYTIKYDVPAAYCEVGACVPSGVVTCDPPVDCPTACGAGASTIPCTDSCKIATTPKSCLATAACPPGDAGACMLVNIYKKVDGAYGVPLTTEQLQTLKVGDIVKGTIKANMSGLSGYFNVILGGQSSGWVLGNIDSTDPTIHYREITIPSAGTFEVSGRVSKTPQ